MKLYVTKKLHKVLFCAVVRVYMKDVDDGIPEWQGLEQLRMRSSRTVDQQLSPARQWLSVCRPQISQTRGKIDISRSSLVTGLSLCLPSVELVFSVTCRLFHMLLPARIWAA